jgi:hypothetical protein
MFDRGALRLSPMRLEFVAESVVLCLHVLDELTRHELVEQLAQGQREALPGVFGQDGVRLLDAGERLLAESFFLRKVRLTKISFMLYLRAAAEKIRPARYRREAFFEAYLGWIRRQLG